MSKDEEFIRYCIKLAEHSLEQEELPFGSIIVKDNRVIAKSGDVTKIKGDLINHAEIMTMRKAQEFFNSSDLSSCAIYSNCEPCAMCSFMIRELKFKKVVFGIYSKIIGGYSKWNILQDKELTTLKPYSNPPEIIGGVLENEASKIFIKHQKQNK